MTLPGVTITQRDQAPPRTPPTDTGVWFIAGQTEKGPVGTGTVVKSMSKFTDVFGDRTSYSVLFDCVETFFKEGGGTCYVSRVVGPAASVATLALDGKLTVSAQGAGDYGNDLQVAVEVTGPEFTLVITDIDDVELERSYALADVTEAVSWSASSRYVTVTPLAGTGNPVASAAAALAGGADDRASITNTERTEALDVFGRDLGPGQVSIPGATHVDIHEALLTHAASSNRVALLDAVDTTSASTLSAAAGAVRALGLGLDRHGALFAPWVEVAGYSGATRRVVPYSAVQAGMIARVDVLLGAYTPSAGEQGVSRTALGFTAEFLDPDREDLTDAGVNIGRMVYGVPKTYGFRTVASPDSSPLHYMLSPVRLDMAITARADAIGERYLFRVIDGKRKVLSQFNGELSAMLLEFYPDGLYGETVDDAFRVDTSVNTDETIAEGKLKAVLTIRRAPFAEMVEIEIVKVAITDRV